MQHCRNGQYPSTLSNTHSLSLCVLQHVPHLCTILRPAQGSKLASSLRLPMHETLSDSDAQ
jgi:hypothetical protein